MIYCVTILGRANEPLFNYKFALNDSSDDDIHLNAVIFSSLDIVEEKLRRLSSTPSLERPLELYFGHLLSYADYKILGLATNTGAKILVACDVGTLDNGPIKDTIMQIYNIYIETTMNPFHVMESQLISTKIHNKVQKLVHDINVGPV